MLKVIDYTKPTRNPSLKEKFDYLVLSTGYVERLLKKKKLDMINEFIESQETKLKLCAIYAKNTLHGVEGLDTSVLDNIFEQKSDLYSFLVFSCKDEKKEDLISWSMSFTQDVEYCAIAGIMDIISDKKILIIDYDAESG